MNRIFLHRYQRIQKLLDANNCSSLTDFFQFKNTEISHKMDDDFTIQLTIKIVKQYHLDKIYLEDLPEEMNNTFLGTSVILRMSISCCPDYPYTRSPQCWKLLSLKSNIRGFEKKINLCIAEHNCDIFFSYTPSFCIHTDILIFLVRLLNGTPKILL
jgi:hypothetical protein